MQHCPSHGQQMCTFSSWFPSFKFLHFTKCFYYEIQANIISHCYSCPYQAWRAQIGSISVTYTMDPIAFKAAQQPFPTCKTMLNMFVQARKVGLYYSIISTNITSSPCWSNHTLQTSDGLQAVSIRVTILPCDAHYHNTIWIVFCFRTETWSSELMCKNIKSSALWLLPDLLMFLAPVLSRFSLLVYNCSPS